MVYDSSYFDVLPPRLATTHFRPDARCDPQLEHNSTSRLKPGQVATVVLLGIFVLFQLLFPLRHHLYPGNVNWTEEGGYFSWRMMLHHKVGRVYFLMTDPKSNKSRVIVRSKYLTGKQITTMSKRPEMILLFSHFLADRIREKKGYHLIEIRARAVVSLNGRKPQLLIDPTVNLVEQKFNLLPAKWIKPLKEPLLSSLWKSK